MKLTLNLTNLIINLKLDYMKMYKKYVGTYVYHSFHDNGLMNMRHTYNNHVNISITAAIHNCPPTTHI